MAHNFLSSDRESGGSVLDAPGISKGMEALALHAVASMMLWIKVENTLVLRCGRFALDIAFIQALNANGHTAVIQCRFYLAGGATSHGFKF